MILWSTGTKAGTFIGCPMTEAILVWFGASTRRLSRLAWNALLDMLTGLANLVLLRMSTVFAPKDMFFKIESNQPHDVLLQSFYYCRGRRKLFTRFSDRLESQ